MSLEQALADNTAALKHLAVVMASASHGVATPVVEKKTTAKAEKKTEQTAATDELGNPVGTVYYNIPAHNTTHFVKPGDHTPSLPGQSVVTAAEYTALKAEYQKNVKTAPAPAADAKVEPATTAVTEPSATAPAATASGAAAEPAWAEVVAKITALHKLGGNDAILPLLTAFGASRVPELQGKAANSVIIAKVDAAIESANSAAALGL